MSVPAAKAEAITFKFIDDSGHEMTIKMLNKDPMSKAIKVYCSRTNKQLEASIWISFDSFDCFWSQ